MVTNEYTCDCFSTVRVGNAEHTYRHYDTGTVNQYRKEIRIP